MKSSLITRLIFDQTLSRRSVGWALPLLAAGQLSLPVHSAPETFTIDPTRSAITLSGNVAGATLLEQAAGSLTTPFSGSIQLDVTPASVQFTGGRSVVPVEAHNWEPGQSGVPGSAPASYGAKASLVIVIFPATAVAATRRLAFDLTSDAALPRTGDTFNSDRLVFRFVDTANSVLDYKVSGAVSSAASKVLSGLSTNKVSTLASLTSAGGVETLTLPVSATYHFTLLSNNDTQLTFQGSIIATRTSGVPEVPVVKFTPPAAPSGPLTLVWSKSYKLQRANQLAPPNWTDYAILSPVDIPLVQPGEYFRVVPK